MRPQPYLTLDIIGANTLVNVLEEPGLAGADLSAPPPGRASHVEIVGDNSLHGVPGHFLREKYSFLLNNSRDENDFYLIGNALPFYFFSKNLS